MVIRTQLHIGYALKYLIAMEECQALKPNNISAGQDFPGILSDHENLHSHRVHIPAPESAASSHLNSLKSTAIYRVFLK